MLNRSKRQQVRKVRAGQQETPHFKFFLPYVLSCALSKVVTGKLERRGCGKCRGQREREGDNLRGSTVKTSGKAEHMELEYGHT